ncbi:MAG: undecaprenyl-diphosphate phosphatase [Thermaerobacter sp.]|nr:undecaprenyl-diphosphate phosphatase [Thermaerobacter sp.]
MTFLQGVVFALVQGVTELFPVSSVGHAVLLPRLLGWQVDQRAASFLPFVVVLHLGTATALFLFFRRDWAGLLRSGWQGLRGGGTAADPERHLLWLIILATLPAAAIGFAFQHRFRELFASPTAAAGFLILNGLVLFAAERLRRRGSRPLEELTWKAALLVGLIQSMALLPGFSRSGVTMVGGLLLGLRHAAAARFAFLLATPIILGAGVLEVPRLLHAGLHGVLGVAIVSGGMAGLAAYLSTAFLMRYFRRREVDALDPFAWYCTLAGLAALLSLR